MAKASVSAIYDKLHNANSYHPFTASTFSDWSLEAGDIVNVSRDGRQYQSPIHSAQLTWKGSPQVTIESTGNEKKESVAVMSSKKLSGSARGGSGYRNSKKKNTSIMQNEDSIILEAHERKSEDDLLSATLTITAREIRTDLVNTAEGLYSFISQTAGEIRSEVHNEIDGCYSTISQTATQIRTEVNSSVSNLQSSITQQANRISLVVEGTGANAKIKAAQIVTAINNGASSVLISANHILLDGNTTLRGALSVISGGIATNGNIQAGLTGGNYIRGESLRLVGSSSSQGAQEYIMTASSLATTIRDASVSGGTLTLTKYNGDTVTFSRAISSWTWGGGNGKVNVTALPQNQTKSINISVDGNSSITSNGTYTYTADYENSDGDDVSTGATKTVTVSVHPNKYTFAVSRTQDQSGYHYTLSIGTGSQTPFPSSGTVDLWK